MIIAGDYPAEIKKIIARISDHPLEKVKDGDLRSLRIEPHPPLVQKESRHHVSRVSAHDADQQRIQKIIGRRDGFNSGV